VTEPIRAKKPFDAWASGGRKADVEITGEHVPAPVVARARVPASQPTGAGDDAEELGEL